MSFYGNTLKQEGFERVKGLICVVCLKIVSDITYLHEFNA